MPASDHPYKWRFRLLYLLLAAAAATVSVAVYVFPPRSLPPHPATVCHGMTGAEKCIRVELSAQGAPDGELTCADAAIPGAPSILCDFNIGAGGGCYDVVAYRDKAGYPLLEAVAQKASC